MLTISTQSDIVYFESIHIYFIHLKSNEMCGWKLDNNYIQYSTKTIIKWVWCICVCEAKYEYLSSFFSLLTV